MSQAICPICLTCSFSDYRSRQQAQCNSCMSLERHRSLKLLMLNLDSSFTNLVILEAIQPFDKFIDSSITKNVLHIDEFSESHVSNGDLSKTLIFIDNKIGFHNIDGATMQKLTKYSKQNAMIVFTCRGGYIDQHQTTLSTFIRDFKNIQQFNPCDSIGKNASMQFMLNVSKKRPGMNDIFYYQRNMSTPLQAIN